MTGRLSALRSSRTFRLHVSPHPAFDRMRFLFTMSEIEDRKERRRTEILVAGRSAFFMPSAFTRSTKLINRIGKDRKLQSARHFVKTSRPGLGGARRDRTDDLMLAKHALSQLSYGPVSRPAGAQRPVVVGLGGLEPPTSRLSSARSNQLSYKPARRRSPRPLTAHQAGRDAGLPYPWIEKERRRRRGPANAA